MLYRLRTPAARRMRVNCASGGPKTRDPLPLPPLFKGREQSAARPERTLAIAGRMGASPKGIERGAISRRLAGRVEDPRWALALGRMAPQPWLGAVSDGARR